MITEVCLYLRNWFDTYQPKFRGKFKIEGGVLISLDGDMGIQDEQYYRIIGSVFNDGVHQNIPADVLKDEEFEGAVWLMAVPSDFISLIGEISAWQNQYGTVNSVNMSPYQSESFGGYSYSKGGGGASSDASNPSWQSVFRDRLWRYKKI